MAAEQVFDVYWDGPCDCSDSVGLSNLSTNCVLYMICGTHGLYGRNVPLYIGKVVRQTLQVRIQQHNAEWLDYEPDPPKVYAAYVGLFDSWAQVAMRAEYPPLPEETINAIESLLIYSHQPVYNTKERKSALQTLGNVRLFNTGRRSTLYPEVSSIYWVDSPASHLSEQIE